MICTEGKKLKPFLNVSQMINHLKEKNIKFNYINEIDAEKYLRENNNYYNLTAYKNNFEVYTNTDGSKKKEYIDLDFAYLKDMAIIDMRLRLLLFKIIIDIEHYLKMNILNEFELIDNEDGYRIVNMFLEEDYNNGQWIHKSISKKVGSEYFEKIIKEYGINGTDMIVNVPIWVFLEIISFGDLVSFYEYYSKEYYLSQNLKDIFILREIVKLRNAVAHNTCILDDIIENNNSHPVDNKISKFINKCNISIGVKNRWLSNRRIRQIVYTIYMFVNVVTSRGVKDNIYDEINTFFYDRLLEHSEYYQNNEALCSIYNFFDKILLNVLNNRV